ncbi:hypothetical protein WH47_01370 [Habropoda laboriosa]|uniref:Uncharacterized protein n=1 Tax=Habropoda laboriosa TaxID=597456 RepID=A0A0L7R657_9HYME|nr:hypothetical protein WH47_01370 [Habropoda laboriosa]
MDRVKIDFQPLAWFRRDLLLRAPGTSVALLPQPARVNIYSEITSLYFFLFFSPPFPLFLYMCVCACVCVFLLHLRASPSFPSEGKFFFLTRHPGKRER